MSVISLKYVWNSKVMVYSWSTWCSQQLYKVSTSLKKNIKFAVKTVWHCCDIKMKYNQGHWKRCEWIKLNEYNHRAKFDIYHIYSVPKNCSIKVFATYWHSDGWMAYHWSLHAHIFHVSQKNKQKNRDKKSTGNGQMPVLPFSLLLLHPTLPPSSTFLSHTHTLRQSQ